MSERIDRINELARKAKTPEGLTEAEQAKRKALHAAYLADFRRNAAAQLENTYIQTPDGVKHKLKKKK